MTTATASAPGYATETSFTVPKIEANKYYTNSGDGYSVTLSPTEHIVDLSTLTDNYEAQNNDVLTGTLAGNYKITVADGATVTLRDATITYSASSPDNSYAGLTCLGDTIIVLEGTSTVQAAYIFWPSVYVVPNHTLTIRGEGTLNASALNGSPAASIGAGYSEVSASCGNIVIESGIINASSSYGAGIGGGVSSSCGNISISGGTVNATSTKSAGIDGGQGNGGSCGNVTISGGTVNATSNGAGAAIGSGLIGTSSNIGGSCGDITISGGNITATATNQGAGIGTGSTLCNSITINGGTINASSTNGVGIGSVSSRSCGAINITGADITAEGAYAGIGAQSGSGDTPVCSSISISTSTVNAQGTKVNSGCGIGLSQQGTIGPITIADDVELTAIKATGAVKCIGKGYSASSYYTIGTITVGGTVYPSGVDANQADGLTFVYPVQETTITWNSSFIGSISHSQFDDAASVPQNGITASFTFGVGLNNSELIIWSSPDNQLTFSSTVGNISKIEIYVDDVENMPEDQGWTFDGTKMTWEGTPASSVTLSGNSSFGEDIYISSISQIVFTVQ